MDTKYGNIETPGYQNGDSQRHLKIAPYFGCRVYSASSLLTDSSSEFSSDSDTDPESSVGAPASKKAKKSKDKPKEEKPSASTATANSKFIVVEILNKITDSIYLLYIDSAILKIRIDFMNILQECF